MIPVLHELCVGLVPFCPPWPGLPIHDANVKAARMVRDIAAINTRSLGRSRVVFFLVRCENSVKETWLFIFLISTHPDNFISPFLSLYKCSHRGSQKRSGRIQERSKKGGISDKNGVAVT